MRQIFVDSRDRVAGTTTDFRIQLPETLTIDGRKHRARIDNLRIPLCVPTIQSGINDTIVVQIGSQKYTATIQAGNYDGPTLASRIQGALAVAPGGWTVQYDISLLTMSVSCTNPFTIVGGTYAAILMARPYTNTSNAYNFTYVSVLGVDIMYLSSPEFNNLDCIGPGGSHDTLMCAVVTQAFGAVLDTSMPYDCWITVPQMTTQTLSFSLRDRSYNVISQVANISFVMTID
jgi:hypothetical protein